jgi:alpha-tubulin suppressor-like RCC1 family protein
VQFQIVAQRDDRPQQVDVAAGSVHTCAITAGGTLVCWGANDSGQLGNGTTAASPTTAPTPVPGLAGVEAVAAGGAHTCARLTGGTVACWGSDTSGQLGDSVVLSDFRPELARIACD